MILLSNQIEFLFANFKKAVYLEGILSDSDSKLEPDFCVSHSSFNGRLSLKSEEYWFVNLASLSSFYPDKTQIQVYIDVNMKKNSVFVY